MRFGPLAASARVVVATWQSLHAKLKANDLDTHALLDQLGGICVDEVHVSAAPALSALLEQTSTEYRIGLSATPLLRTDGRNEWTLRFFGDVIYRIEAPELADAGMLLPARVQFVPGPITRAVGYRTSIVRNHERNALIGELASGAQKPCLVLINHVEHGHRLRAELYAHRLRTRLLTQEDSDEARDEAIDQLRKGALDVLVATPIFDAGIDIPELRSVVVGAGGRSAIAAIQRLGRGMRLAPGKTHCELWDIADRGSPRLEANAECRAKAYAMAGFEVRMPDITVEASVQPKRGFSNGAQPVERTPAQWTPHAVHTVHPMYLARPIVAAPQPKWWQWILPITWVTATLFTGCWLGC